MITKNIVKPTSTTSSTKSRDSWLPITIILIAATVLFTYRLDVEGVWIDELFSIRDAIAFEDPIVGYSANKLRPLYYALLSIWMKFGNNDAWLRSLSVIFGIVSVFLIYRLGKRLSGNTEGLIAAALLSTSPLFINHTQEIRMYVMSVCLGLAGTLFLTEALLTKQPEKPSQKVLAGWAIFRLLAIFTMPLNLTLLIPDTLLTLLRFRKERASLLSVGKWLGLILIVWSPTVATAISQVSPTSTYAVERTNYSARPGLSNLVNPIKFWMIWPYVVKGNAFLHAFYRGFTLLIAGVIGAGLIYKRKSASLAWAGFWFILPLPPIIACSLVAARLWEPRYVLFTCPYLFILMAAGFARLWRDWKLAATVITAVYIVGISGALAHYYTVQNRADYKFNIATIEQYEQPGDALIWGYRWQEALPHYYDGTSETHLFPAQELDTPEKVREWIAQFPKDYERSWLVIENTKKLNENYEQIITENYSIEERFNYTQGSAVFLLTPPNDSALSITAN